MKKSNNLMLKVAVLSVSLLMLAPSAVSVIMANLFTEFPDVPASLINMTLTLPFLLEIPFSFLGSYLSNVMKKKTLVCIAVILAIIGGIGPMFCSSFTAILVLRAILGAGVGLILPMGAGLIAMYFSPDEQPKLFGAQAVVLNVGGIAFTFITGWLALVSWRTVFWIYGIAVIVLILVVLFLGEPKPAALPEGAAPERPKLKMNKNLWLYCIVGFLQGVALYVMFTNCSTFITSTGIGDSALVGTLLMLMSIGGLVLGFVFAPLYGAAKRFTAFIGLALMAIGFMLMGISHGVALCVIATLAIGFGGNIIQVLLSTLVAKHTTPETAPAGMGIMMAFLFGGEFASPFIVSFVADILGMSTEAKKFILAAICLAIAAVISFIVMAGKKEEAQA